MPSRRGAGAVLLVAFAIAVLVVSTAPLITPTEVKTDEQFESAFYDIRDFAAGVEAASKYYPPDKRREFIEDSLQSFSALMEDRGVSVSFNAPDDGNICLLYTSPSPRDRG